VTLRTRLAVIAAAILALAVGAVGAVLSQTTRHALMDPVDERLSQLGRELTRSGGAARPAPPEPPEGGRDPGRQTRPEGRDAAMLRFVDGTRDEAFPSGFDSDPDALPAVDASVADGMAVGTWRLVDLPSEDGSLDFRAVVLVLRGADERFGSTTVADDARVVHVFARPLDTVDATVARLRWTALAAAVVALVVGALATWSMVRRSLRPVESTIDTAARIGEGDLSLRVPEPERPAELRSLGRSINAMLDGLETAQSAEVAARGALSQFVADASHELRTPIAAVSGHAELLASGVLDAETRRRSVGRISAEAARMQRLVDDLLTLASHDTGHRRPHREVHLSAVVSDAVEDARAIDGRRRYVAEVADDVRVPGDEQQLLQVVGNLLGNVRSHTPPGTTTTVRLTSVDGRARLVVADDGPGIPEANRARLFERFFRQAGPGDGSGAGLGLAIVAALVSEHHGTVRLVPSELGTEVEVLLPEV